MRAVVFYFVLRVVPPASTSGPLLLNQEALPTVASACIPNRNFGAPLVMPLKKTTILPSSGSDDSESTDSDSTDSDETATGPTFVEVIEFEAVHA